MKCSLYSLEEDNRIDLDCLHDATIQGNYDIEEAMEFEIKCASVCNFLRIAPIFLRMYKKNSNLNLINFNVKR